MPQLGRRPALPLAAAADAVGDGGTEEPAAVAAAAAGRPVVLSRQQPQQPRQRGPAEDSQILVIDFSSIDVDDLRPSCLLR